MVPEFLSTGVLSLADPLGSSPLVAAMVWLQSTLLGTIATTIAIISVASVGAMMLSGQLSYRRGVTVVAGCFILFGASSIVAGLQSSIAGRGVPVQHAVDATPPVVIPPPQAGYDPYAGASVPPR